MSVASKAIIAGAFLEGIGGAFAAAVTGDPAPAIGAISIAIPTLIGGIALEESERRQRQDVQVAHQ